MKQTKKSEIENWFMNEIYKGKYKAYSSIPSEQELINHFNVSRMTIRNVIDKLKILGVLYSKKGSSVFVSPFYKSNIIMRQEIFLDADFVEVLPTNQIIPEDVLSMFDSDGIRKKWLGYVKIYFKNKTAISYSISWINHTYCRDLVFKDLKTTSFINYMTDRLKEDCSKTEINTLEKITSSDISMLQMDKDKDLMPTTYSGYFSPEGKLLQIRIQKTIPSRYKNFSHKNKIVSW